MPTDDLTPAAEAFLRQWCPAMGHSLHDPTFEAALAALLAEVRGEERERAAAMLDATAARIRGPRKRVPQVDVHVAWVMEQEAEKIRRGNER